MKKFSGKGTEKMNYEKKIPPLGESWCEYRKKHYTAEEIAENDLMVKQSVIARMESGKK